MGISILKETPKLQKAEEKKMIIRNKKLHIAKNNNHKMKPK